jgi:hypothetical protein
MRPPFFVARRERGRILGSWHITYVAWAWLRYKAKIMALFFW